MEKKFLIDQRTTRLMQITGVDVILSKKNPDSSSIDLLTDDLDKMIDGISGGEHQVTKTVSDEINIVKRGTRMRQTDMEYQIVVRPRS